MTDTTSQDMVSSRKWWVLATVGSGVLLATIDGSIVNIALPTIRADFDTSFRAIQWVPLAYLLTIATLTLGTGRLGDIVGKKRIYTSGFALFTVASALCGFAVNVEMLISMRILQALGAVMILSLGAAVLIEAFPASERGKALGFIGTFVSVGVMAGPTMGGLLLSVFEWRAIFFVNIPVGIVGVLLALRWVPDTPPHPGQRLDVPGMILLSAALFCFSFSITRAQEVGFGDTWNVVLLVAALIAAGAWVRVERRVASPMLPLELFRNPMLSVSVISGFVVFMLASPAFFLLPFYLSGVLEFDIRTVGLLLGVAPLAVGLVAPLSGSWSDRIGIRRLTMAGLLIVTLSFLAFQFLTETTEPWQFALIALPLGIGMGMFQSPNNSAIMGSMPPQYAGVGAGVLSITRLLGQVTGISIIGTVWAARVVALSGEPRFGTNASAAPGAFQVAALRDVYLWAVPVLLVGIGAGIWGLRRERELVR